MTTQRSAGIATVMFTDVEASTETTTRLGDDAAAALFSAHHRVVLDLIAAHHGRNVESTGDGFLVLFDSARGALWCALEIQRELAARADGIRVRIGLNAGEIPEGDHDLFGAAINLAKRVMDRADGVAHRCRAQRDGDPRCRSSAGLCGPGWNAGPSRSS